MSKYIDFDYVKSKKRLDMKSMRHSVWMQDIYSAPSIDIVRCGECKYWHKNRKEGDGMNVFDVCYDFQADDFCSYGERREP